jgi:predicted PurR-regulated permease PerM
MTGWAGVWREDRNPGAVGMTLAPAQRQVIAAVGLVAALALLLWLLAPVLTPFVIAAVLGYALHPAVECLRRWRSPRMLAVVVVEFTAVAAVLMVALLIVPVLANELPLLKDQLPGLLRRAVTVALPWLAQWGIHVDPDLSSVQTWLKQALDANFGDWLAGALASVRIGGSVLLAMLGNLVLVPVVLFYLLSDWSGIVGRLQALLPPWLREQTLDFFGECDLVLGRYLRGQLLVMLALAVYYSAALALVGLHLALPLGILTGLAIAVPYVGFGVGLILALTAAALEFGSGAGIANVMAVYLIGQVLEGFVVTPRLIGNRIGLTPLGVIFALLAFGQLLGFVGVLIALPASAVAVVALRRLRAHYLGSRLYTG